MTCRLMSDVRSTGKKLRMARSYGECDSHSTAFLRLLGLWVGSVNQSVRIISADKKFITVPVRPEPSAVYQIQYLEVIRVTFDKICCWCNLKTKSRRLQLVQWRFTNLLIQAPSMILILHYTFVAWFSWKLCKRHWRWWNRPCTLTSDSLHNRAHSWYENAECLWFFEILSQLPGEEATRRDKITETENRTVIESGWSWLHYEAGICRLEHHYFFFCMAWLQNLFYVRPWRRFLCTVKGLVSASSMSIWTRSRYVINKASCFGATLFWKQHRNKCCVYHL